MRPWPLPRFPPPPPPSPFPPSPAIAKMASRICIKIDNEDHNEESVSAGVSPLLFVPLFVTAKWFNCNLFVGACPVFIAAVFCCSGHLTPSRPPSFLLACRGFGPLVRLRRWVHAICGCFPETPGLAVEGTGFPPWRALFLTPSMCSAPPLFPPPFPPPLSAPVPPFLPPPLGVCWCVAVGLPPLGPVAWGGAPGGRFPVLRRGRGRFPPAPPWSSRSAPWWPQAPRGVAEPRGEVEVSLALGISNIGCYKEDIPMGLAGWDPWSLHVAYLGSGEVML